MLWVMGSVAVKWERVWRGMVGIRYGCHLDGFGGGVLNRETTTLGTTMLDPNGFLYGEISAGY